MTEKKKDTANQMAEKISGAAQRAGLEVILAADSLPDLLPLLRPVFLANSDKPLQQHQRSLSRMTRPSFSIFWKSPQHFRTDSSESATITSGFPTSV